MGCLTNKCRIRSNGIVAGTARTDLDDLMRRRLMVRSKRGKQVLYLVAPGLVDRLRRRSGR